MKEVTSYDSWGLGLHHHKLKEYLEVGEAEHRSLFLRSHMAKLWKLAQEIYWAAAADQGRLKLKDFEWLDLSGPLATHEIVLPWCDKTSERTETKTARRRGRRGWGVEHCWYDQGNTMFWHDSNNWRLHSFSTADQPPHSMELLNLKIRASYKLQKKITNFLKKESLSSEAWLPLKCIPQGWAWIIKHFPTGLVHIFTNKMQELKAKYDRQNVNIHDVL